MATVLGIGDLADRAVPPYDCVATVRRAIDAGLNVIDTAPSYEDGYSEQIVGEALRGRREGMFLIDKIDLLDEAVAPQVEGSLTRLGLGSVDLFVFHAVKELDQWRKLTGPDGGFAQLEDCVRAGKTRFRGISTHHPQVARTAIESGLCDVILFPVGPFCDSRYIDECLPLAKRLGVGAVCFKTFGAGKLLGDTEGYGRPLARRPRGKFSSGGVPTGSAPSLPALSVSECVNFTLTCDPDVALLGLSFPNEQDEAFAAATTFRRLSEEEMASVRKRALEAVDGKGPCWWNPDDGP
jgi:aryl-alcohol dehydrogenase-like predicted oxidoreductase